MRQIILDTETTGLKPEQGHRVIEIGCVELVNRQFTGNNFHCYLNPEREIDPGALKIHGINNAFLEDKPRFPEIMASLLAYIKDAELIIHNAPFDIGFLNYEMSLSKTCELRVTDICKVVDTLLMARHLHPGQRNSLDALCGRYRIDNSHRDLHGALLDAEILGRVYLAMTSGQISFLNVMNERQNEPNQATGLTKPVGSQHKVIYANPNELAAHNELLQLLEKESGERIWETEE